MIGLSCNMHHGDIHKQWYTLHICQIWMLFAAGLVPGQMSAKWAEVIVAALSSAVGREAALCLADGPSKALQAVKQVMGEYCPATSAIVSFGRPFAQRLLAVSLFATHSLKRATTSALPNPSSPILPRLYLSAWRCA